MPDRESMTQAGICPSCFFARILQQGCARSATGFPARERSLDAARVLPGQGTKLRSLWILRRPSWVCLLKPLEQPVVVLRLLWKRSITW